MTKPDVLLIEPGYIPDSLIERIATSTMPPLGLLQVAVFVSCGVASRDKPVVILLHEYSSTAGHLDAFFRTIRNSPPQQRPRH